ncbi:hypothetical protein DFH08DRAFT_942668 [Mycena albidolilacea]|uniref:Uncharacterized protein n=1 Tax=Mycena albidolilacea TaxID=1033008 RepID=A0AAD6ZCK3_9AGAR|nr:hypothetical protein DFH08DRAFT_942668 [Mycena albidolilacea]
MAEGGGRGSDATAHTGMGRQPHELSAPARCGAHSHRRVPVQQACVLEWSVGRIAARRRLYCLQASATVGASRMIEGDQRERKTVRNMGKIRQPSQWDAEASGCMYGVGDKGGHSERRTRSIKDAARVCRGESIWAVPSHLSGRGRVGCVARAKKRLEARKSLCRRDVQRWGRSGCCTGCGDKNRCRGWATGASAEGGGGTLLVGVVISEFQDGSVREGEGGGRPARAAQRAQDGSGGTRGRRVRGLASGEESGLRKGTAEGNQDARTLAVGE